MAIKCPRKKYETYVNIESDGIVYRTIIRAGDNCVVVVNPGGRDQRIALMNATVDQLVRYLRDSHLPVDEVLRAAELVGDDEDDPLAPDLGGEG